MKKKRLKKEVYVFLVILIVVILGVTIFTFYKKYTTSDKYLLLKKGYDVEQVVKILKNKKMTATLLKHDYNLTIIDFMDEKYYIESNLDSYLTYKKSNPKMKNNEVVSIINVGADKNWYDVTTPTDVSDDRLMLVNKFNYLPDDYVIDDLVTMSIKYSFSGKQIRSEVNEAFKNLSSQAKLEGLTIVANSTYRDYKYQDGLYKRYKNQKGTIYADSYAARPGHSEHQTGLAIDVSTLKSSLDTFHETKEYKWLLKNAHLYGFILRYPKGKENLTGYNYESWHFRYVGNKVATQIYNEGITFDEYYAYYMR